MKALCYIVFYTSVQNTLVLYSATLVDSDMHIHEQFKAVSHIQLILTS